MSSHKSSQQVLKELFWISDFIPDVTFNFLFLLRKSKEDLLAMTSFGIKRLVLFVPQMEFNIPGRSSTGSSLTAGVFPLELPLLAQSVIK